MGAPQNIFPSIFLVPKVSLLKPRAAVTSSCDTKRLLTACALSLFPGKLLKVSLSSLSLPGVVKGEASR